MSLSSVLQMTEVCSVKFASSKDCDVVRTAQAILETDPNLTDCNVIVSPDFENNEASITGSWHAISHLRDQLMAVFCSATERHQSLVGGAIQALVNNVVGGGITQEGQGAKNAEGIANTANAVQRAMDASNSKRELHNKRSNMPECMNSRPECLLHKSTWLYQLIPYSLKCQCSFKSCVIYVPSL